MAKAEQAARGAAWTIGSSLAARVIGVVSTVLITRYLDPDVVGEVTSATILVVTASHLSNFGLGNYAIAKHGDGPDVTFASTVVYTLLGIVALGAVLLFGKEFAGIINAPHIGEYIPGMVLAIFIRRLFHMPDKVLARELRFGPIGVSLAVGEFSFAISSVAFAMLGWGGAAIVWGNVIQSSVMAVIVISQVDWRSWLRPHKIRWARLQDQARFGIPLGLVATAHYASTKWDNLLFSAYFGSAQMGQYNMAYGLAAMPAEQIGDQVGSVLFPSMSQVDGDAKARALVRSIALMGLLVFPLGIGLFSVSDSLVAAVLNDKWQGVAPILSALALITVVQPIAWASGSYLMSKGHNWALTSQEFIKLAALGLGLALFAPYGPIWACAGVGLSFAIQSAVYFYLLIKDGIPAGPLWGAMTRPILPCIPMAAAVFAVRGGLGDVSPLLSLLVEVAVGALVFIPAAFVLCGGIAKDFVKLASAALGR